MQAAQFPGFENLPFHNFRPGPKGIIVPNEKGRTNVLDRYLNDEITLTLPEGKKIVDIAWFAIYDLSLHDAFGDIYIPEDFEPPDVQVSSERYDTNHNDIQLTGKTFCPLSPFCRYREWCGAPRHAAITILCKNNTQDISRYSSAEWCIQDIVISLMMKLQVTVQNVHKHKM
jgi:hypothetical protein